MNVFFMRNQHPLISCCLTVAIIAACMFPALANPLENELLPAQRYFPLDTEVIYVYRSTANVPWDYNEPVTNLVYQTVDNPLGDGTMFKLIGATYGENHALFQDLQYVGKIEKTRRPEPGDPKYYLEQDFTYRVLPENLEASGQQWVSLVRSADNEWFPDIHVETWLDGVETTTVHGISYEGCLRVDFEVIMPDFNMEGWDITYLSEPGIVLSGSYWLAPDVGFVKGFVKVEWVKEKDSSWYFGSLDAGMELIRIELLCRVPTANQDE